MRRTGLFSISLLILSGLTFAQQDFRAGYIIQLNGDTLYGEVDYRGDLLMGKKCTFKALIDEKIMEYNPGDIAAFRFIDSKFFVSKNVKGADYFLEFLIKGKINIYYLRDEVGEYYFLEKEGMEIVEIPYKEGIRYVHDPGKLTSSPYDYPSPHYYSTTKHIGFLKVYMQDADNFESQIERVKKPDHNSLIKIAEEYHKKVCIDEECIIFEKKLPMLRINPELVFGLVDYANIRDLTEAYYFTGGLILNFWIPRSNEKLFFRTGLVATQIMIDDEELLLIKCPLQLEYQYPSGIVRPKIAMGINLYSPFFQSVAFGGGVNIRLHRSLFLAVDSDIDFIPGRFPLWPTRLFSYSVLSGLYYSF